MWSEESIIGFDTETTGIRPKKDRLVTCSIVLVSPEGVDKHYWLADPGVEIPERASAIHGITTAQARSQGRPIGEVLEEIATTLAEHMAAGRRVIDHLGNSGQPAVHESRIADDADHAPRLRGRQHMPQAKADANARAHADAGIHAGKRRQHTQRIATDITGNNAVKPVQGLKHRAVRAAFAQSRRLAGQRRGLWRIVMRQDASHALGIEFAETERVGLALDGQPIRPQFGQENRIAFLNHHAMFDRGDKITDGLHRQRIGKPQLQNTGFGCGFTCMGRGNAGSDDPQCLALHVDDCLGTMLGIFRRQRQLLTQFTVRRSSIGRNHHARWHIPPKIRIAGRRRHGGLFDNAL